MTDKEIEEFKYYFIMVKRYYRDWDESLTILEYIKIWWKFRKEYSNSFDHFVEKVL